MTCDRTCENVWERDEIYMQIMWRCEITSFALWNHILCTWFMSFPYASMICWPGTRAQAPKAATTARPGPAQCRLEARARVPVPTCQKVSNNPKIDWKILWFDTFTWLWYFVNTCGVLCIHSFTFISRFIFKYVVLHSRGLALRVCHATEQN